MKRPSVIGPFAWSACGFMWAAMFAVPAVAMNYQPFGWLYFNWHTVLFLLMGIGGFALGMVRWARAVDRP